MHSVNSSRQVHWVSHGSSQWSATLGNHMISIYRGGFYPGYVFSRVDSDLQTWKKAQAVPALNAALRTCFQSLRRARIAAEAVLNSLEANNAGSRT